VFSVKFHLKTWSLLSGMTLSLALIGGCSNEEAAPEANPPATTTPETVPAPTTTTETPTTTTETPATTTTPPAEPAPAVEAPKPEPAKPEAKDEAK
jgi:outer membrane biosynthesis protein TonB